MSGADLRLAYFTLTERAKRALQYLVTFWCPEPDVTRVLVLGCDFLWHGVTEVKLPLLIFVIGDCWRGIFPTRVEVCDGRHLPSRGIHNKGLICL